VPSKVVSSHLSGRGDGEFGFVNMGMRGFGMGGLLLMFVEEVDELGIMLKVNMGVMISSSIFICCKL